MWIVWKRDEASRQLLRLRVMWQHDGVWMKLHGEPGGDTVMVDKEYVPGRLPSVGSHITLRRGCYLREKHGVKTCVVTAGAQCDLAPEPSSWYVTCSENGYASFRVYLSDIE